MIFKSEMLRRLAPLAVVVGLMIAAPPPGRAAETTACPDLAPDSAIYVRMLQNIDSGINKAGDTFDAVLLEPLKVNGKEVAGPAAPAKVRLVRLLQPKGSPAPPLFALQLVQLRMNRKACAVATGFGQAASGTLHVDKAQMPEGTTSTKAIVDALTEDNPMGSFEEAIVNGAGVSFEMVSGDDVKVTKDALIRFEVANLATVLQ